MKTRYFTLTLASALMMLVTFSAMAQVGRTQYSRPLSTEGLTVFESDKSDQKPFDGLAIYWGAASHSSSRCWITKTPLAACSRSATDSTWPRPT